MGRGFACRKDLQASCGEDYGDGHFPAAGDLEVPDFPERDEIHCEVGHNVEGCGCDVKGGYTHAFSRRVEKPYLFARVAKENGNKEINGVEDGVEDIQSLQNPVEGVQFFGAENAQHEE